MTNIVPIAEPLRQGVSLTVHESITAGLERESGVTIAGTLSTEDGRLLGDWADNVCDNPSGQRADIARAIAAIVRAGNGARVVTAEPMAGGTFWDAVSR